MASLTDRSEMPSPGNVGTIVSVRVGALDASILGREFEPQMSGQDLVNLPNRNGVVKLMIEGMPSRAFTAETVRWDDVLVC